MPKAVNVSIDEYLGSRKLAATDDGVVYRAIKAPRSFNPESRSARFVMTDETVDSYGDIVRAKGADLSRFVTNPIALLNHRADLVIGTWEDVEVKPKRVEGTVRLAEEGTAPHIDMTFNLMRQGILRAASIGFVPLAVEKIRDENGEWTHGYDIKEWELLETSVVSIPANPSALAKAMRDGDRMARDLIEQVLDEYVKTPSGLIVPREEFEAAHKEGSGFKIVFGQGEIRVTPLEREPDDTQGASVEKVASLRDVDGNEPFYIDADGNVFVVKDKSNADEPVDDLSDDAAWREACKRRSAEELFDAYLEKTVEESLEQIASEDGDESTSIAITFRGPIEDVSSGEDAADRKSRVIEGLAKAVKRLFGVEEEAAQPEATPADPEVQKALAERLERIVARHAA